MRGLRSLAVALIGSAALAGCRHAAGAEGLEARTLRAEAPADGASGSPVPMRATYFPASVPRAGRKGTPLLVVEPLLFQRELLFDGPHGGLVTYLASSGFRVWLVGPAGPAIPNTTDLAHGIRIAAEAIAREAGVRRFDLLGLSLGGEAALGALDGLTAPGSGVEIRRVAFVGAGFDFAYPHSFAARVAPHLGPGGAPASALCTLDGDTGCARLFHDASGASSWLGALPAEDPAALRPASERFPFVARFTALPVLFVTGKADGIAPSESMFPLFLLWGSQEHDRRAIPKHLFLAGRENGFARDDDQFDLFGSEEARDEVWTHLAAWLASGE
ncbi:MAG TPA: hypothetical protein VGI39_15195 [Polyangiaceae bacterium]